MTVAISQSSSSPSASSAAPAQAAASNAGAQASEAVKTPQTPNAQAQAGSKESGAGAGAGGAGESKTIAEELEEISLGSVKSKVSKDVAKAIKELQKGFTQSTQKLSATQKYFQGIASQAKDNPLVADAILQELGIDPDQYSQTKLAKKLELELMDPKDRELLMTKAERDQLKKEREDEQTKHRERQQSEAYERDSKKMRGEMLEAWQKSGMPANPKIGAWMAATMAQAQSLAKRGDPDFQSFTWDDAAAIVREEQTALLREITRSLDPQKLQEFLGDEPLSKWREFDVKRVTDPASQNQATRNRPPAPGASSRQQKISLNESEWRDWRESGLTVEEWNRQRQKGA